MELEGSVSQQTLHYKSAYRTVKFDFYKEDGFCEGIEPIQATADHKKKTRKLIQHFAACIGDSCDIEYTMTENNINYTRNMQLQSGDVFFIDQKASGFGYRVKKVHEATKPNDLCIRDGALICKFEKN